MTIVLATSPYIQFFDNNGNPLDGGLVYTYAAGTTTPKVTYTDASGTTPSSNPIVLDSAGRAVWFIEGSYKYVVQNSSGVTIRTVDNVTSFSTASGLSLLGEIASNTVVGNNTGASAYPTALTATQLLSLLGMSVLPSTISGLIISSLSGSATTAALSISSGVASSSNTSVFISSSSTLNWAVSNGNAANGYQGGTNLPANDTIHVFVTSGPSGEASFAHNGLTPTLRPGYTDYRRIGSFKTDSGGAPIPYTSIEIGGGATLNYLNTQTLDVSVTNQGTSRIFYVANVPADIRTMLIARALTYTNATYLYSSPDEQDVAPAGYGTNTVPLWDGDANTKYAPNVLSNIVTDTSGRFGVRASTNGCGLYVTTRGWIDFRR